MIDNSHKSPYILERSFELTNEENSLFKLLLEVQSLYCPNVILRVAGGWVRDKILGGQSKDIDICLNEMGKTFAEYVNQYNVRNGGESHTIGVIKANQELNKHLETASMKIRGIWVDFVNLRSKSDFQTEIGNQPPIVGNPLEDALYRDLTINSLFYNINTNKIEDWCGTGIEDLTKKCIKTPLKPEITFGDDPLRILRAFRFAAKLNFKVVPEIEICAQNPAIKEKLAKKISRERIGNEVMAILGTKNPLIAFNYIAKLGLIDAVFQFPESVKMEENDKNKCIIYTEKLFGLLPHIEVDLSTDQYKIFILSSFLIPFCNYEHYIKSKKFPVILHIFTNSLKYTKKDTETGLTLLTSIQKWKPIIKNIKNDNFNRKETGLLLKEIQNLWLGSMAIALLDEMESLNENEILKSTELWKKLKKNIEDQNLCDVWNLKPFYNGAQIMEILHLSEGKIVGKIMHELFCWQLMNPHATGSDCLQWLINTSFT